MDAEAFSSCTSPKTYMALSEGAHSFDVRATDAAGNVDPTPATFSWTIDKTAPDTSITSSPPSLSSSTSPSFEFSSTETGSTFECSLDASAYAACSSPKQLSGLLADHDLLRASYAAAAAEGYLWHEFGDVHLILP